MNLWTVDILWTLEMCTWSQHLGYCNLHWHSSLTPIYLYLYKMTFDILMAINSSPQVDVRYCAIQRLLNIALWYDALVVHSSWFTCSWYMYIHVMQYGLKYCKLQGHSSLIQDSKQNMLNCALLYDALVAYLVVLYIHVVPVWCYC